jgi:tetratricopeptide (TPR) repeat protein
MKNRMLILAILSMLLYLPSVFGGFMWDDDDMITDDHYVHSVANAGKVFLPGYWKRDFPGAESRYRPARSLLLMAEWKTFGRSPAGYHAVSLALNALAVCLAFWLSFLLLKDPDKAFVSALLFAVHPVHVESVAWIKNVTDVLMFIFSACAAWAFISAIEKGRSGWRAFAPAALCFALALASKENAVMLPAQLFAWLVLLGGERPRAAAMRVLPMAAAAAVFFVFVAFFLRRGPGAGYFGPGNALLAFSQYSRLLFLPFDLNADRSLVTAADLAGPVLLLAAGIYCYRSGKRVAIYGAAWAVLAVAPFLDIGLLTGRPIAEQRLYSAVLGLGLMAGDLYSPTRLKRAALGLAVLVFAGFSFLRNFDWLDPVVFWEKTVRSSPASPRARANLGLSYERAGRLADAAREYEASALLAPELPEFHLNFADLMYKAGRGKEAVAIYASVLSRAPGNRRALLGLMRLKLDAGDVAGAEKTGTELLAAFPGDAVAVNSMGVIYMVSGRPAEAEAAFKKAIAANPEFVDAMYNLAGLYRGTGRLKEAATEYEGLLKVAPSHADALNNLAILSDMDGKEEKAVELFRRAQAAAPGYFQASYNLGGIYYRRKMYLEALSEYTRVLSIRPDHAQAAAKAGEIRKLLNEDHGK